MSGPTDDPKTGERPADVLLEMIRELAAELHPRRALPRRATLDGSLIRDWGLDSLARVELLARIGKRFRVGLSERVLADIETPRDLLRAVLSAGPAQSVAGTPEIVEIGTADAAEAPHAARTLLDVVNWHVERHPDRPHILFYSDREGEAEDRMTYRQLRDGAANLAARLQHGGLKRGEPVAIMLLTGRDYFFAYLGVLLAGGVPVPIYPPARRGQIEDHLLRHRAILRNAGAGILILIPEAKLFAQMLKSQVENLRNLMTVEELTSGPGTYLEPRLSEHDIAFLQYTSGSTGNPKGVILTHANLLANIRAMGEAVRIEPADVVVSWLPLYHDMGLIGAWMCSLYFACPLVLMSPLTFLSQPQRWLWAIHRYRGTISAAPNFAYELCLKRIEDEDLKGLDLRSWRIACNGAEPVSPETIENFCRRFQPYGFRREAMMPVYGLAECSVGLTFPPLDRGPLIDRIQRDPFMSSGRALPADPADASALRFVACGRPLRGHEIRILDPADRELPERREGRLQFRGPSATSGYFRNAEETARLFADDWLESGDMAYLAGGDLFLTGRKKDIVIRAGRNIYPQELEEAIGKLPGIRKGNVVVFGASDPATGTERLVVVAETREEGPEKLDALRESIDALAVDLTGAAADETVLARPGTILKTSSGKIRRAGNRKLYEEGHFSGGRRAARGAFARIALAGLVTELRRLRRTAADLSFAAYAWLLFWLAAPLTWAAVIAAPLPSWRWAAMRAAARFLARATGTPLAVEGRGNLPRERPCILVANHASYLDGFVAVAAIPLEFSFVAKSELTAKFLYRFFLNRIGTRFVERFDRLKGIEDATRLTAAGRAGHSLFFFAEGTFSRIPGLLPFHMGAFLAAADANLPVVPVAIRGTRSILLDQTWFPRRGRIEVVIGEAIEPGAVADPAAPDTWTTALKLRDLARDHILRHCGEPDLAGEDSPV
ncbi:MAG TPA: AMP-binding protein [Syntrophales bacterium]|nr:AMP-binding protein [Syntrophales bacterium]